MNKLLTILTLPLRIPLRLGAWVAVVVAGAVALGDVVAPVRACVRDGVTWLLPGGGSEFDPRATESPAKELTYLAGLNTRLEPTLTRARTLMRQRRAEIEFSREQARFCEQQLAPEEMMRLRGLVAQPGTSPDTKTMSPAAACWVATQLRIEQQQDELNRLLQLDQRVSLLVARMEQRRKETQGLVPTATSTAEALPGRTPNTPEIGEAEQLLTEVHEKLFKALYTISPGLVDE
jgi:hypothetical protein